MIVLVPYDPAWPGAFAREAARLTESLGDVLLSVEHIGSTSIPGLAAKPVIDILAVAADVDALDTRTTSFETLGYQGMGEFGIVGRRYFRKGDADGRRTHQVHVYSLGTAEITHRFHSRHRTQAVI